MAYRGLLLVICYLGVCGKTTAIQWNGDWAFACDFAGGDLSQATIPGDQCGGRCASTAGCTHYTWTTWNGGTCFMKQGQGSKADAFSTSDQSMVCGVNDAIQWNGNWAFGCDFVGNDLKSVQVPGDQCGGLCASTQGCTHFTWTSYAGGTCFMKLWSVSKSDAFKTSDSSMVCGVVDVTTSTPSVVAGHEIRMKNYCSKSVTVFSLENGAGKQTQSWPLGSQQELVRQLPNKWAGRFYARYADVAPLSGWPQPDSLAEINFDGFMGLDFLRHQLGGWFRCPCQDDSHTRNIFQKRSRQQKL
ncbi:hypothetical protein BV898_03924 [Hypsibius exemplaris]|uniref:Apple domain-containing protein n=1 Tax=Hypsibius exemplaris TaxID=2072580 RepID=A0A1W0X3K6_HYPEX|nr:hypothetical protein BV898_03924 [Hypsibius exemplaris]